MRGAKTFRRGARLVAGGAGVLVFLRLVGCADPSGVAGPTGADRHAVPSAGLAAVTSTFTLVGAADIASCSSNQGDEKTAAIINNLLLSDPTATVFAAGDVVYDNATATEFTNCYNPSWGAFKANTRPALGNHEYNVSPTPYFNYFGSAAGDPSKGYYSYDLGTWHIIVLNSNIQTTVGSAQLLWLSADLAATSQPCVLAYWHHARFASAVNSTTPIVYKPVKPFWDALYAAKADVLLVGHQHFYERFAPMTSAGVLDNANGLREFVVGTGGKSAGGSFQATAPNSQVKNTGTFGVLKLTLDATSYSWQFLPQAGKSFTDTGAGTCHPKGGGGGATTLQVDGGNNQSATAGTAVSTPPSVKVTDAGSNPVAGVSVTFAVAIGGGSITGGSQTTNGSGIATVGSWTLGTVAGANSLTASSAGLTGSPATFNATSIPDAANAAASRATVPNGVIGSPTAIAVQAKDQYGNNLTGGGSTVGVTVTGANSATPTVTDNSDGTYSASYTPTATGLDQVAITLDGSAIGGSPYSSTVTNGNATTIALNGGNNQSATVGTAVTTAPSVLVTNASNQPVAGVAVTFAVATGGGSVTGGSATTDGNGIATVGSWTLGTTAGTNTLTATSAGLSGSPITFTATSTPGAPTLIVVVSGNNQTAQVNTAVLTRPKVKLKDTFGNGVPGVTVTFAVASGGGSVTGAVVVSDGVGAARVGSWILGPTPGTNNNTLTATASGSGIANNPLTFVASATP